jgi:hypothetical protein
VKRSTVIAVVLAATACFACGSKAAPSSFKTGRYILILNSGNLVTGDPPCSGLPAAASYFANVLFEADGAGFRAHGTDANANATFDLRIQVDGESLSGTVTGALRDASFSAVDPATLTFAANADGSTARFVGRFSVAPVGISGSGSIDGRPTISVPSNPPLSGACSANQLKWTIAGPS